MRWTCKKIKPFIVDYLESKLSVQDKFTYEAHMETCPGGRDCVAQRPPGSKSSVGIDLRTLYRAIYSPKRTRDNYWL
jgi:hypothetical protein